MLVAVATLLCSMTANAYDFEVNGFYYNIISTADLTAEFTSPTGNTYSGNVIIPSNVTYKGRTFTVVSISRAFADCNNITSVTIPNSVTNIGDLAFANCNSLTSITIPNSVTNIGNHAFCECYNLASITIPGSVTNIGDCAFQRCESLTSITIPNSVVSIGGLAFQHCESLTSITIPNSVTNMGSYAFQRCLSLVSATISNSIGRIEEGTFYCCESLTSITIPNSAWHIGAYAFYGCTNLKDLTFGQKIAVIEESAFKECPSLTTVNSIRKTFYGEAMSFSSEAFDIKTYTEATLRIPKGSLAEYQSLPCWKEFWDIVEVDDFEDNGVITNYYVNARYDFNQGSVTINGVSGTNATIKANEKIEFEIIPFAGYEIDKIDLNGIDITADIINGKYTIASANEDITLEVTFKIQTFALTLKCCEVGSFEMRIKYGETATCKINPSANWTISSVTFNGRDVTGELTNNVFTTPAITCDSELNVVFADINTSVYMSNSTRNVIVSASRQTILIKGLEENTLVEVFNTNGNLYYSTVTNDDELNVSATEGGVYVIKVGERTFKVVL